MPLVFPQQAVVDEDADELFADRLVQQRRDDGGIDPAGETADHPRFSDLLANVLHGLLDEVAHRPASRAFADLVKEVAEDLLAARRVRHLGMKLHAVEWPAR